MDSSGGGSVERRGQMVSSTGPYSALQRENPAGFISITIQTLNFSLEEGDGSEFRTLKTDFSSFDLL